VAGRDSAAESGQEVAVSAAANLVIRCSSPSSSQFEQDPQTSVYPAATGAGSQNTAWRSGVWIPSHSAGRRSGTLTQDAAGRRDWLSRSARSAARTGICSAACVRAWTNLLIARLASQFATSLAVKPRNHTKDRGLSRSGSPVPLLFVPG
jgi:hypothetical protein